MNTTTIEMYDVIVKDNKRELEEIYYCPSREHKDSIQKIYSHLGNSPEAVILDAGCGIGNFAITLAPRSKFVYGIDFSGETIKLAKKRARKKNVKNVSFKVASVTSIPFEDKSMDKILCYGVFQYINYSEINVVIKEFKRLLKNDGFIIIGFLNGICPLGLMVKLRRLIRRIIKGQKQYISNYASFNKIKELIRNEGGDIELIHSGYFFHKFFSSKFMRSLVIRLYFEKHFPKFLKNFGLSIVIKVKFDDDKY